MRDVRRPKTVSHPARVLLLGFAVVAAGCSHRYVVVPETYRQLAELHPPERTEVLVPARRVATDGRGFDHPGQPVLLRGETLRLDTNPEPVEGGRYVAMSASRVHPMAWVGLGIVGLGVTGLATSPAWADASWSDKHNCVDCEAQAVIGIGFFCVAALVGGSIIGLIGASKRGPESRRDPKRTVLGTTTAARGAAE